MYTWIQIVIFAKEQTFFAAQRGLDNLFPASRNELFDSLGSAKKNWKRNGSESIVRITRKVWMSNKSRTHEFLREPEDRHEEHVRVFTDMQLTFTENPGSKNQKIHPKQFQNRLTTRKTDYVFWIAQTQVLPIVRLVFWRRSDRLFSNVKLENYSSVSPELMILVLQLSILIEFWKSSTQLFNS